MIVATAGHVDHGKTELIKALTGVDTDRLPEEKRRGLSIDLGFAYITLPDGTKLGFVDVPGHHRFIRNMLSGVGGADSSLLVVASDDGVMPQTREHVAILDLLDIRQCVVALTKIDIVEAQRKKQVSAEISELLAGTVMQGSTIVPVCAPQGIGISDILTALQQQRRKRTDMNGSGAFRMAVDRCFSVQGAGTVVTGMVFGGSISVGADLIVSPIGLKARVRSIRVHNEPSEQTMAGDRCAINIAGRGVSATSVVRGHWLVDEELYAPTSCIDVMLRILPSESRPLKHWTPVHLHHGASHSSARVAVLSGGSISPGSSGLAQLVVDAELGALWGDRIILRDQSGQRTVAGGVVIDPAAKKRGRAKPERAVLLRSMAVNDHVEAMAGMARSSASGVETRSFMLARNLDKHVLDQVISQCHLIRVCCSDQERCFDACQWQELLDQVLEGIQRFHISNPGMPGANPRQVQRYVKPHVPIPVIDSVLTDLAAARKIARIGSVVHLPNHEITLSADDHNLWEDVSILLSVGAGTPPSLEQAAVQLNLEKAVFESFLKRVAGAGLAVRIACNRYLNTADARKLIQLLHELSDSADGGCFTAAQFRDCAGLGRNFIVDFLDWLDRCGITTRDGDVRRIKQ